MNLRSGQRWEVTRAGAGGQDCVHQGPGGSETRVEGQRQQGGAAVPENSPVRLLSLLPIDQARKEAERLGAWETETERKTWELLEARLQPPPRGPLVCLGLETEQPPLTTPHPWGSPGKPPPRCWVRGQCPALTTRRPSGCPGPWGLIYVRQAE